MLATLLSLLLPLAAPQTHGAADRDLATVIQGAAEAMRSPAGTKAATERLAAALATLAAQPKALEPADYVACAQALVKAQQPDAAVTVCELGLGQPGAPSLLHRLLGSSRLMQAQAAGTDAAMRASAQAAVAAFLQARAADNLPPAQRSQLQQAYMVVGDFAAARREFEALAAERPPGARTASAAHFLRGLLLLGEGEAAAACGELGHGELAERERLAAAVVLPRALFLAGRADEAVSRARASWQVERRSEHLALLADLLACTGKADEARALLTANPPQRGQLDDTRFVRLQHSRAAFELLLGIRGEPPADLRRQLTARLQHRLQVDGDDGKPVDLAESPFGCALLLQQAPAGPTGWANDLLFALCVRDAAGHVPGPREQAVLGQRIPAPLRAELLGDGARAAARRRLLARLVEDGAEAPLLALRLADRP